MLPELCADSAPANHLADEFSSQNNPMSPGEVVDTLRRRRLLLDQLVEDGSELLA